LMWYFPFYAISQFSAKMLQKCDEPILPNNTTQISFGALGAGMGSSQRTPYHWRQRIEK
jgi:hypothetical protein